MADQARLPAFDAGADVLSVSEVHRRVRGMAEAFGVLWVEGEVSEVKVRNGHRYLTLTERGAGFKGADCQLKAVCWASTWARIAARLGSLGLEITPGTVVQLMGKLTAWDRAEVVLVAGRVNTDALVGRAALAKRRLLEALERENLLRRNAGAPLGLVPLRLGLVAAPGTEGLADFMGVLKASGFGFHVLHVGVTVQGAEAAGQMVNAIELLEGKVDLIAIVRGGGSRGDLAAFDDELLARAICGAGVPVWCGVGHTGDRSVADEVAHRSHPTPTACAEALRQMVHDYRAGIDGRREAISRRAEVTIADAGRALASASGAVHLNATKTLQSAGSDLARMSSRIEAGALRSESDAERGMAARAVLLRAHALHKLDALGHGLSERVRNLEGAAGRQVSAAERALIRCRSRVTHEAGMSKVAQHRKHLDASGDRLNATAANRLRREAAAVGATRKLLNAYDPLRQLERGWTLTTTTEGRVVRSTSELDQGQHLVTRFADGTATSVVTATSASHSDGRLSDAETEEGERRRD